MTPPSKRHLLVTLVVAVVAVLGMVAVPASASAAAGDAGTSVGTQDVGTHSPVAAGQTDDVLDGGAAGSTGDALTGGAAGLPATEPTTEGSGATSTAGVAEEDIVYDCAATPPDDFSDPEDADSEDVIGWVDGYWYNEPLEIDADDGLTEDELEELSARTAARFEAMRCLPLKEMPTVEVITRDEYQEELEETYEGIGDETRMYDNAKLATTLKVGQDEDSIEVREASRAATVGGFYNFEEERIVVITDDPDDLPIDEAILAHELGHAIQDQHFDLGGYDRNTTDLDKAKLGVIEGDVHWIEHEYERHCDEENWNEPCIIDRDDAGDGDVQEPPNWAITLKNYQPYSDGPTFVKHVYEEGDGWEDVDALYEELPRNSTKIIYPEKYGEFEPEDLTVEDRSDDDWERLDPEDRPEHDVIGQAGITAAFMAPTWETGTRTNIVDPQRAQNFAGPRELDPFNPLNYDHPETDGWQGDRMYVYHDGEERTGTVWKTAWENPEEAERFADAYVELIDYRGGEPVEGYDGVYAFDEDSEFDMAVSVQVDGDRAWIVTAPTVEELDAIHDGAAVEATPTPSPGPGETPTSDSQVGDGIPSSDEIIVPGFGAGTALVAVLLATLALRRQ